MKKYFTIIISALFLLCSCGREYTVTDKFSLLKGTWGCNRINQVVRINGKIYSDDSFDISYNPQMPQYNVYSGQFKIVIDSYRDNELSIKEYDYDPDADIWIEEKYGFWYYKDNKFYYNYEDWSLGFSYTLEEDQLILEGTETDYNYEVFEGDYKKEITTAECYYKWVFELLE